jgi:tetratricopeptide (TPR) repeat protein
MVRHPTARRVHRPADADDVFVERVLETTVWARTHQRRIVIFGVTALVLALSFLWYRNFRSTLSERAASELTTVRQTVLSGNMALAVRDLETYLETYGGTPQAREARLLLGQSYLETNQPQKAVETIQAQAGNLGDPLGPSSAFLLADAHEALGDFPRAEEVLLRIADGAPVSFQKERALDAVARIRTERGDAAGAVAAYDRLLALLSETSPDRVVYDMRRAEAQARASAGS